MRLAERFWSRVERGDADACWEWQAGRHTYGYGRISVGGAAQYAHRLAWTLTHGDPGELHVLHRCDNPPCCNPAHLFLGTAKDNMADKTLKRRGKVAKLTPEDVVQVKALAKAGHSQVALGRLFGVDTTTVGGILRGRTWRLFDAA